MLYAHKFALEPCGRVQLHFCHDMNLGLFFSPFIEQFLAWEKGIGTNESRFNTVVNKLNYIGYSRIGIQLERVTT